MTRRALVHAVAFVATTAATHRVGGQTLAGRVSRGSAPVSGALIMLVDANGRTVAQAASREGGAYAVTAPAAGSYRAQVLQIGWRPTVVGPFALRTGATTPANIDVTGARIPLDAIVISDRSDCRVHPDSAAAAFILWDEARKALMSATMTQTEPLSISLSRTEQNLDRDGGRVLWDSTKIESGRSLNPFTTLAPEVLAQRGYMSGALGTDKVYWAPDATVLLSESFLSSHCIRPQLASTRSADSARLIGVGFTPVAKRNGIVDVEGVVWLDRTTAELRAIDYHYVNTTKVIERADPRGRVEFLRIPGGRWIVDRWSIRVPSTAVGIRRGDAPTIPGVVRVDTPVEELTAIRRTSGRVTEIRREGSVLWEAGRVTLLVRVVDSISGRPVSGVLVRSAESSSALASDSTGSVRIDRVAPGPMTLRLESSELEAVGRSPILTPVDVPPTNDVTVSVTVPSARAVVVARCGNRALEWGEGLLRGSVPIVADFPAEKTPVIVTWRTAYQRLGGGEPVFAEDRREISPAPNGEFEVCGVPRDAVVTVRRSNDAGDGVTTRFAPGALAARVSIR